MNALTEVDNHRAKQLYAYWLMCGFTAPKGVRLEVFSRVLRGWAEPHRCYHTLQHLLECLELLESVTKGSPWPRAVVIALFFHDVVYDPRRGDNEAKSAELARQALTELGESEDFAEQVVGLIMATCHDGAPATADAKLLVDVDLAILGAGPLRYAQYKQQVRDEYSFVATPEFVRGRAKVLRSFLDRPGPLYHTPILRNQLESVARQNMAQELTSLSA